MIYKFLTLTSNKRLKITVQANSKAEALSRIQFTNKPLLVARLRHPLVNNPANPTACDTEQNNSLLSMGGCGYDERTTKTNGGNRSRKLSGIFLPKIHTLSTATNGCCVSIEFVARATPRTKAEFIRTNKRDCVPLVVVVDPLPRLLSVGKFLANNPTEKFTMKAPQNLTALYAENPPILSTSQSMGVTNPANPTACDTEQNNSLPSMGGCGYDERTTKTLYADRKRNSSGIFLPKIHNHGITTPEIHSELAVRATRRNKADFIRTNNADCYKAVVEPLSHPISDKPLSLTKTLYIMKKITQTPTGTTATNSPIVRSPRFEGVTYA